MLLGGSFVDGHGFYLVRLIILNAGFGLRRLLNFRAFRLSTYPG
jgi:hypothetical protein